VRGRLSSGGPSKRETSQAKYSGTWDTPRIETKTFHGETGEPTKRAEKILNLNHFCNLQQPHLSSPLASSVHLPVMEACASCGE